MAGAVGGGSQAGLGLNTWQAGALWMILFLITGILHSAETAFTKISPWKVKEFVEEEGPESAFAVCGRPEDNTKILTTILLTTTSLSIYSTALFVATVTHLFPGLSLGFITAMLTGITLLFGELLPKALAASNPEIVIRSMAGPISFMAALIQPLTAGVALVSHLFFALMGLRSEEDKNVTEDMLRLMVAEAQRDPTTGIESQEGRMIKGVLDLQEQTVEKIMKPRVDMIALPVDASATELLEVAMTTRYSRIPVYDGDIDKIVGIVFTKDLLSFIDPSDRTATDIRIQARWKEVTVQDLMVPTYFVPETMKTWNAMQELRHRNKHMAIVVDEYGGTSGLVTFEDILEEVVGEIYDEDDVDDERTDLQTISVDANGSFSIVGNAELDDVCEALGIQLEEETREQYSTLGGLLCSSAGAIPQRADRVVLGGYCFTITEVDDRRVLGVTAEATPDLEDGWEGDWDAYWTARRDTQAVQLEEKIKGEQYDGERSGTRRDRLTDRPTDSASTGSPQDSDEGEEGASVDLSVSDPPVMPEVPVGSTLSFRDGEWVVVGTRRDEEN